MEFHSIMMKTRYWLGKLTNLYRLHRLATYFAIHFLQTRKYHNSILDVVKTYYWPIRCLSHNTEILRILRISSIGPTLCPKDPQAIISTELRRLSLNKGQLCSSIQNLFHSQLPGLSPQSELYRPSDRRMSATLMPTFAERGCHVVSATDPHGRILGFLDRSRYYFFQAAPQLYSRG
jgi:hypothetical protein